MALTVEERKLLEKRKELEFRVDDWIKLTWESPMKFYHAACRKVDSTMTKSVTGKTAILLPVLLMVRNGARVAHNTSNYDEDYKWANVAAKLTAAGTLIAGAVFGAQTVFNAITPYTAFLGSTTGPLAAGAAAVAGAALAAVPAFTAGIWLVSSTVGFVGAVISVFGAIKNVPRAFGRFGDAWNGIKYSEEFKRSLEEEFENVSLEERHQNRLLSKVVNESYGFNAGQQQTLLVTLKKEFDKAVSEEPPALSAKDMKKYMDVEKYVWRMDNTRKQELLQRLETRPPGR